MKKFLISLILALCSSVVMAAGGGETLEQSGADLNDKASLQRGAKLFVNYCMGCHSLKYMRYSRVASDLDLSEEEVQRWLNFTGAKFGEPMLAAMKPEDATKWVGALAPDLSLTARVKLGGPDWIYTYLKSFYVDPARPLGWNNKLFPNASMPNPLWELQGIQVAEMGKDANGQPIVTHLQMSSPGTLSAEEYDRVARDLSNFLEYAAEPAALKRQAIGAYVVLFLAFLTFMAWMLKTEYWRDVH
ncbi:MAG: cytochrome c1 [Ahniella sp.]|nr:cytochrome c1 [Ahniella sp.]